MSSEDVAEEKKYLLTGVIVEPGKYFPKQDRRVVIKSPKGNLYTCIAPADYFSNFHEDDIVKCVLNKIYDHGHDTGEYRFIRKPVLTLSADRKAIEKCFVRALKGTQFGIVSAGMLYDGIELSTRGKERPTVMVDGEPQPLPHYEDVYGIDGVISFMTDWATLFRESGSTLAVQALTSRSTLREIQAKKLLSWWYKNRCLRRLHFLGLSNVQIKKFDMDCDEIYRNAITKPFTLAPIPLDTCFYILDAIGGKYEKSDVRCGEILRKLYYCVEVGAHACVPVANFEREFPDFHKHWNQLLAEYGIVMDGRLLYLKYYHEVELYVADYIDALIKETAIINSTKKETAASQQENNYSIKTLTDEQKRAIDGALKNKISIITGAPGTGKTAITKEIYNNLKLRGIGMAACSYTGKAVVRLNEALESTSANPIAQTMDMMISRAERSGPRTDFEVLLIDEASMLATTLLYRFIKIFTHKYSIILVGDKDQLPPVSATFFLKQALSCLRIPVYTLTQNQRLRKPFLNAEEEAKNNLELINKAPSEIKFDNTILDVIEELGNPNRDYRVPMPFETASNASTLSQAKGFHICDEQIDFIKEMLIQLKGGGTCYSEIRAVCPFAKYGHLTILNNFFQEVFLSDVPGIENAGIIWKKGDRVMLVQNNYNIGVFNGEEGRVTEVTDIGVRVQFKAKMEKDEMTEKDPNFEVFFNFKIADEYELKNLDGEDITETKWEGDLHVSMIQHSSALSTHKCQGSEYPFLIVYIPDIPQIWDKKGRITSFLSVPLLYVAISRAQSTVWMVTTPKILGEISMRKLPLRYDNLAGRLFKMRDPLLEKETYRVVIKTPEKILRDQAEALEDTDIFEPDDSFWEE